jgi:OOP family OmpA-OmpF porin
MGLSMMTGMQKYDDQQSIENGMPLQLGLSYLYNRNWGVEISGSLTDSETKIGAIDTDNPQVRLDGLYHFDNGQDLVPYLAAGVGSYALRAGGNRNSDSSLNAGGGFNYYFTDHYAWRSDLRFLKVNDSNDSQNMLLTTGLTVLFDTHKKPADSDGDGVVDPLDKCAATPAGASVDGSGCPLDSDNDGIPDYADSCSATPRGAQVDAKGCELDSDSDGIPNSGDECPATASGVAVGSNGCPLDSDGDGVIDANDKCANTTAGVVVDASGCQQFTEEKVSIELAVEFGKNSADIDPSYHAQLGEIADFLKQYSVLAVIEGHTDSMGKDSYNKTLSQKRADNIRYYLIGQFGVDPIQVTARGYGSEKPIASNKTREGRAKNRRVMMSLSTTVRR